MSTTTWMPRSDTFREYPLLIQKVDDEIGARWYSKGHHEPEQFLAAIPRLLRDGYHLRIDQVQQEWWATRCGWGMTGQDGEYKYLTHPVDPWANGAYPVTVIEI